MSITIEVDESLLRAAEEATNIHDPDALVRKGLQSLCGGKARRTSAVPKPFDFDVALAAAAALPDLSDEEFERWEKEINRPLPPPWSACD